MNEETTMLKLFYNPTTWRFKVNGKTGTFTAKNRQEAQKTLFQLLGKEAYMASLVKLLDKSEV